ncbi:MAG: hypothetical protein C0598_02205, partial [Marinilabiliales bacterium]
VVLRKNTIALQAFLSFQFALRCLALYFNYWLKANFIPNRSTASGFQPRKPIALKGHSKNTC